MMMSYTRSPVSSQSKGGFSLIELVAVLAITSLLAVALSFRWFTPWQRINYATDLEKIKSLQQFAREYAAANHRPVLLAIDYQDRKIHCLSNDGKTRIRSFTAMPGIKVKGFVVPGRTIENGPSTLLVSEDGSTTTFAVLVGLGDRTTWLVFAGRSGQCTITGKSNYVQQLFNTLSSQGIDAH